VITRNTQGDELRVRQGVLANTVRIEVVRFDGRRLYSIEMTPIEAAYLADSLHRMARGMVSPAGGGS